MGALRHVTRTSHRSSAAGKRADRVASAVRSGSDRGLHAAFFKAAAAVQKRHSKCFSRVTACGVQRRKCEPQDRRKLNCTPSLVLPSNAAPKKKPPSSLGRTPSFPPLKSAAAHQSGNAPCRRRLSPARAQTQQGKEAKALTSVEFGDILRGCENAVNSKKARGEFIGEPIWCFDNARPQTHHGRARDEEAAERTGQGMHAGWERLRPPPPCPDFQKVIEHTFGRFKTLLHEEIYGWHVKNPSTREPNVMPVAEVRAAAQRAIVKTASAATIKADVDSLVDTLEIIAHDKGVNFIGSRGKVLTGTGGDWPPKEYR